MTGDAGATAAADAVCPAAGAGGADRAAARIRAPELAGPSPRVLPGAQLLSSASARAC